MARFLFTVWPFAGHVHPSLAVAHALRARGHEVAFYTGSTVCSTVEGEGFRCFPFKEVNEERVCALASSEIPYCPSFWDRLRHARALQEKFREWLLDTVPQQVEDIEAEKMTPITSPTRQASTSKQHHALGLSTRTQIGDIPVDRLSGSG